MKIWEPKSQITVCTLFLLALLALCLPLFAEWTEDMRLTDHGSEIYPQIIARNDTLHVAWFQIAGDHLVSYLRSLDGGETWGELVDLSEQEHRSFRLDLSLSNDKIIAGWGDYIPLETVHIAYSISLGGGYWPLPSYLIPDDYRANQMAFCGAGDSLYIVYHADSHDSTDYWPIRFLYSPDLGQTWSTEQTIGYTMTYINDILIKKCASTIFIVWSSVPVPESTTFEVITVLSHDGGESWSEKIILSEDGGRPAQDPCISCNKATDEVVVGWMDHNYPGDLYLRITPDGGYTWEPEIHVTDHHAISSPNIEFVDDTLWAVWVDRSFSSQWELGYTKSIDRGLAWDPIDRLTFAGGFSLTPWFSYDDSNLHLVWYEVSRPPHGGIEIYYKHWEPETSIDNVTKPESIVFLESYPNPFNSTTLLSYSNLEGGDIEIYEITGRLVKQLNDGGRLEGKVTWDATDASGKTVSSGIYFVKARGANKNEIIKLVYLR